MDKQDLRERIWDALESEGIARFPFPPHGRIPNFAGADDAADRLAETPEWRQAETIKANPDAPQLPVRRKALREGKTLYMAQPRLKSEKPFLELDPAEVRDIDEATTVSGVSKHGVPVGPDGIPEIDLIVSGSVAVTAEGTRIGKGEGYSDLEFAVLREFDLVGDETPTATTVHGIQMVPEAPDPDAHDVPMDLVVSPEGVVRTEAGEKPTGIDWSALSKERIDEIPVLGVIES
ncbi:5-formyltetrahydrofolate cyclo-ligase [Halalkalicoccus jeotgali]|uniref:5-formyltetrahydrofolate cyclo-ligase n=1 Tax=Halalkalicoccus jeotgali (strain DSM 18796 / CECT 7217 / JCM 14584 / KCTC 4019 / B3) TaxID=795797 RepID=D8J8K8_HALJB|nr:5-formyltetrahydrofolate cyclo-ligase [Halalkalicoccus jeotgali]ADJ16254.1 5-formyltetrahydrofolate cyclo-ligase [Halalkalicoccus jeotgali B3]ELY36989.1 5-formyltetrahydrofolate cyclo-ligase [Halalkalicoccus jeotgali B3]